MYYKITLNIYNYPSDKPGDLLYRMLKEIGVRSVNVSNYFTRFEFNAEYGHDIKAIINQVEESIKELGSYIGDLDFDISYEEINGKFEIIIDEAYTVLDDILIVPENKKEYYIDNGSKYKIILDMTKCAGSGKHQSTQTLLWGIKNYSKDSKSLLDIGSGNGILPIFAFMNGIDKLYCCDKDPDSKNAILHNVELNNINSSNFIFYDDIKNIEKNNYDLITMNLSFNMTASILKDVKELMNDNTKLLISGFHNTKIKDMSIMLNTNGFRISESMHIGLWTVFICNK